MMKMPKFLLRASLVAFAPIAANAAGTYYTGNYQSPQTRYANQSYASRGTTTQTRGYNNSGNSSYAAYSATRPVVGTRTTQTTVARNTTTPVVTTSTSKSGFWADAEISHQMAQWQFEMKSTGSILHYDNVGWNVLDLHGGYAFNAGNTKMQVDAGFQYGMQSGDSTMVDDDITNGGYSSGDFTNDGTTIKSLYGHALSIGKSDGGNMYGFNVGFGLTDFMKFGNMKITPSLGYRYFKYKLETKNNYGLMVDNIECYENNGETRCFPVVRFIGSGTDSYLSMTSPKSDGLIDIPSGATKIDTMGTFYYSQSGTSHSYETEWSGPYIALDMDYMINANNSVNGRVELGLPGYTSTGDQPYRFDWAHPKSVEDSAGIGSAFHLGMGANWMTALTNTVSLTLGLTYDYYTVSDAESKTYLNGNYYQTAYDTILAAWVANGKTEAEMLNRETGDADAIYINDLKSECPGWVCKTDNEIKSFYKSMGIRVGINAKF